MADGTGCDQEVLEPAEDGHAAPRAVDRWRKNTASGAIAAGIAMGLQQVFDPQKKDTIAIEQQAPTKPADPEGVDLHFDPNHRGSSFVVIRRPSPPE